MEILEARKASLESRIAALRQQATQAARRDDSRRKILLGAAMIAAVDAGAIAPEIVQKLLSRFLTRPGDRAAFASGRFQIPAEPSTAEPGGTK